MYKLNEQVNTIQLDPHFRWKGNPCIKDPDELIYLGGQCRKWLYLTPVIF